MDPNNNETSSDKYRLRPRKRCDPAEPEDDCGQDEVWTKRRRRSSGGKSAAQPLSKYRRKTANARERSRMREINEAFDTLRRAVPVGGGEGAERLTKISTLRLAMSYIAALSEALEQSGGEPSSPGDCSSTMVDPIEEMDEFDVFGPATIDFDDFLAIDIT